MSARFFLSFHFIISLSHIRSVFRLKCVSVYKLSGFGEKSIFSFYNLSSLYSLWLDRANKEIQTKSNMGVCLCVHTKTA